MSVIKRVVIEFIEENPPAVLHGIQQSWREIREFQLSSGFFRGIIRCYGDDPLIAGPLTYERAKATILLNLETIPFGFTQQISSSWWSQYELICRDCGGKGGGTLLFTLRKLVVYKAAAHDSIESKNLADGSPTYVYRVPGKLECSKCHRVVEINYPSNTQ